MASLFKRVRKSWPQIYFFLVITGLLFTYGVVVGTYKIFPYEILEKVAAVSIDWARYPAHNARLRPEKFLAAPRRGDSDSVIQDPEKIYPGVTFVTGFFDRSNGMKLLGMDGQVIHEWRVSYNEIWPVANHVREKIHDWDIQIHGAILYPDGDIIFNFQYAGLVRIDKCSRVKWKLPERTHHSIHEDSEGNLWVPSRKWREERVDEYPHVTPPFEDEYIIKVSPEGNLLREISVLNAIYRSGYEGVLFANGAHKSRLSIPLDRDFIHLNDVEILSPELASAFPSFEERDILISLRNLNLLLVLDFLDEKVKWSMTGPYLRQHDPDFLANGRISVFDNRRDDSSGASFGGSRILEFDPLTRDVLVTYKGTRDRPFYTETMGDHQHLPNGNILITESDLGRAFEVSANGEIVWSFINRWNEDSVALIGRATRYPEHFGTSVAAAICN